MALTFHLSTIKQIRAPFGLFHNILQEYLLFDKIEIVLSIVKVIYIIHLNRLGLGVRD